MVGDRPANLVGFRDRHLYEPPCTPEGLTPLFCTNSTTSPKCDPYFEQILRTRPKSIGIRRAIQGFSDDTWRGNLWSKYRRAGDILTHGNADEEPASDANAFWVFEDTTTR